MSASTLIYDLGISSLQLLYRAASLVHGKARLFHQGRKEQQLILHQTFPRQDKTKPLVWVHCASLGEFEQGRPVIEALKNRNPAIQILLTFFSPSGYEVQKKYAGADFVFYLPWDTRAHARWFAEQVMPNLVIFVKYEFWFHYIHAMQAHHIPVISVSSIFRDDQIFFKPHGGLFRQMLSKFNHFFVQNEHSHYLLKSIGINAITLAGDTRFDRVHQITQRAEAVELAARFKNGKTLMVIGSAWPEDMDVLIPFINHQPASMKFIIAPHEIKDSFLSTIEKGIQGKTIRYSRAAGEQIQDARILLIDNVGLLSRLYRYGEFAFVGGGFVQGLHNILEAACYGLPVFFGDQAYKKFQEAVDLAEQGGAFPIHDLNDINEKFRRLQEDQGAIAEAAKVTRQYVEKNLGATDKIVSYCEEILRTWRAA
ncbi:MAG TPA: glycosyltransferase N-terminal domain-containing protein [Cyclobacteriaceae bacterium]|nr:glycosyltransferase N-terminal domain-containing protein [Cyclobacteriaceae bacterium]